MIYTFGRIGITRDEVLWDIPLAQLNQLVHVHLRKHGCVCRRGGQREKVEDRFDALYDRYAKTDINANLQ